MNRGEVMIGAALLCAACSGMVGPPTPAGTEAGAVDFSRLLAGKSILFVGAHPDDESVSLAMMAEACLFNGATCRFVVASEHKSYGCSLANSVADPHECTRLRRKEMLASAALVNGTATFYGWEDLFFAHDEAGLERTIDRWARDNGGRAALVARFRRTLEETNPDVVLALDPRHGTSCHPNHRAATLLLMDAIHGLPAESRPAVFFENDFYVVTKMDEDTAAQFANGAIIAWPGDPAPMHWYDASRTLPNGRQAYDYVVDSLRAHASQYPAIAYGSTSPNPPASRRRVPYVRPADIDMSADLCTALELDYPTFDVHGFPPDS